MDLLGLKNLTAMHDTLRMVERDYGKEVVLSQINSSHDEIRYHDIPLNDRDTYKLLAEGITTGVFQLESPGMTQTIVDMLADIDGLSDEEITEQCFERLIAVVALYRPGPMDSIPAYIEGMRDQSKIHYDHESLKGILSSTYGIIVYQEQVIQIVKELAGFSGGQADDVRKAMGKKIAEKMEKAHKIFIHGNKEAYESGVDRHYAPGCIANGIPEDVATVIWNKMADFAKYAFNRSHAACYAWISYLTAYMACHWSSQFYAAMLTTYAGTDKFNEYLSSATTQYIEILQPCVNNSGAEFDVKDGSIMYSLQGIKAVNSVAPLIASERGANGAYKNPDDFLNRITEAGGKLGKGTWEGLVYAGALDCFGYNRKELINAFSAFVNTQKTTAEERFMGQISLFTEAQTATFVTPCKDYTERQKLAYEYDVLGIYISGHPLDGALEKLSPEENIVSVDNFSMNETMVGKTVSIIGQAKNVQMRMARSGDSMCTFSLRGRYKEVKCVLFPRQFQVVGTVSGNSIISVTGKVGEDSGFGNQILVDAVGTGFETRSNHNESLVITVTSKESQEALLQLLNQVSEGNTPVFLQVPGSEKKYPINRSVQNSASLLNSLVNWEYSIA